MEGKQSALAPALYTLKTTTNIREVVSKIKPVGIDECPIMRVTEEFRCLCVQSSNLILQTPVGG